MAAHQIALQVIHFSFLPAFAVGEAASVLAGQAVGAERDELVLRGRARSLWRRRARTPAPARWSSRFGAPLIVAGFTRRSRRVAALAVHAPPRGGGLPDARRRQHRRARGAARRRRRALRRPSSACVTSWAFTPPLTWLLGYRARPGRARRLARLRRRDRAWRRVILWWRLERGLWLPAARASRERLAAAKRSGAALAGLEAA